MVVKLHRFISVSGNTDYEEKEESDEEVESEYCITDYEEEESDYCFL